MIHQRGAVLLVELYKLIDFQFDRIELGHDRLVQIVIVRAHPIVSDAKLPHRRNHRFEIWRAHVRLIASANLLHAQAVLLHGAHKLRQLLRDLLRIDMAGIRLNGWLDAAACHFNRCLRDFIWIAEPVQMSRVSVHD